MRGARGLHTHLAPALGTRVAGVRDECRTQAAFLPPSEHADPAAAPYRTQERRADGPPPTPQCLPPAASRATPLPPGTTAVRLRACGMHGQQCSRGERCRSGCDPGNAGSSERGTPVSGQRRPARQGHCPPATTGCFRSLMSVGWGQRNVRISVIKTGQE